MNSTEIVLFTIIVFLFIIAIFMFVLLRKSFGKKRMHEVKKFEYKDIVNITPEFKFETPGFNTPDIPSIDEIMKPITAETKESKETTEEKDMKTHDEELKEILITEPKIIESDADDNEPKALADDDSSLKLEDTLVDIEDEKKEHKKAIAKKPETKVAEKYLKKRKSVRKKRESKEVPREVQKELPREVPKEVEIKKEPEKSL